MFEILNIYLFSLQKIFLYLSFFQLNTGSREVIDLNVGPVTGRINSAGSDLSLGSLENVKGTLMSDRRDSSSSVSSVEGNRRLNSLERDRKSKDRQSGSVGRRREQTYEKRVGSAGSDSDSSLGSTLKATESASRSDPMATLTPESVVPSMYEYDDAITYEQLQAMIESVLVECGYYSVSPQGREVRL